MGTSRTATTISLSERAVKVGTISPAVRKGVFYGLGEGDIDLSSVLGRLRKQDYRGWIVVEDELPPGMGEPLESARRDRAYMRSLGI